MFLRGRKEPHAHLFSSLWPEQGPCAELAGSSRALLPSFPGALSCLAWCPVPVKQDRGCLEELGLQHGFLLHWLVWGGWVAAEEAAANH